MTGRNGRPPVTLAKSAIHLAKVETSAATKAAGPSSVIQTPVAAAAAEAPHRAASAAAKAGAKIWLIYYIRRLADGRGYVGVTSRTLPVRLAGHSHMARMRPDLGGPGTLAAAIRQAFAQGQPLDQAFQVECLAIASTPNEARGLERDWIARLGTLHPNGFNIMPGGASLGGPANAMPVMIDHPTRGTLHYASLMDAVTGLDRERRHGGQPPLRLGVIYARRALGWPLEEALGLRSHADARRRRAAFRWHGRSYETLRDLALAERLPIDTIRSRLHRARQAGCGARYDAAHDRRLAGSPRTGGIRCGRQPPLALPHPTDPAADPVDAATFARLNGLPRATILHRYHRLVAGNGGSAALSRDAALAALHQRLERRALITLPLPGGPTLYGGVREVIAKVLSTPALKWGRAEHLGFSAIRARLRRIPGWRQNLAPQAALWAFGFQPDAGPASVKPPAVDRAA